MKNILKKVARSLALAPAMALVLSFAAVPFSGPTQAAAPTCGDSSKLDATTGANCAQGNGQQGDLFGSSGIFRTVTNVLLFLIGAVAVIMLIIGGIRYTVSGGDSSAVTAAKNTILYSIVGIIVALLAYAVVNFVLDSFTS